MSTLKNNQSHNLAIRIQAEIDKVSSTARFHDDDSAQEYVSMLNEALNLLGSGANHEYVAKLIGFVL